MLFLRLYCKLFCCGKNERFFFALW